MNSEKVKEIKGKLQEEIFIANSFGDKLRKVPTKELQNLLTLINELESEKERLLKSCKNCHYIKDLELANSHSKELKDRIIELELVSKEILQEMLDFIHNETFRKGYELKKVERKIKEIAKIKGIKVVE